MLREKIVFGPIHSRRLGKSLGINLLPERGKLCNFDCVYCECGWNKDGLGDRRLPKPEDLREALGAKLRRCTEEGLGIDSLTFSGDGEPTLNPHFPEMVDVALALRNKYFPRALVSVLSNATQLGRDEIVAALLRVDNPILKLDASTDELAKKINKPPAGYSVRAIVDGMRKFRGNFILQTMFLKGPGFDSLDGSNLKGWMDIVRELRPREVMVYTIDRPAPAEGLEKYSAQKMLEAVRPLMDEEFNIKITE